MGADAVVLAAWIGSALQPQPMSRKVSSGLSRSLRQIMSSLSRCARAMSSCGSVKCAQL